MGNPNYKQLQKAITEMIGKNTIRHIERNRKLAEINHSLRD